MSVAKYYGWFGRNARKRCPHRVLAPIWGDDIEMVGGWRLQCADCDQYLDGPVSLAAQRSECESSDGEG